ncbi:MAG: hypothetical protein IKM07_06915 [Clostridia bacterium]|nr:hypothetical protein [Clostridia bacterium]
MEQKNRILAVTPGEYEEVRRRYPTFPMGLAQLAYRISAGGRLLRDSRSPANLRGGILVLCDMGFHAQTLGIPTLLRDLLAEIAGRGYEGVAADFSASLSAPLAAFLQELDRTLHDRGIPLWVNESCRNHVTHARLLIQAAATAGSLEAMLRQRCERYGTERVTAELVPLRLDFALPAADSQGQVLSRAELETLITELRPQPYFSSELCAKYFTYMSPERQAHFVLFDDGDTLAEKCRLAEKLGISHVFALYAEVENLLDVLVREGNEG